MKSPTIQTEKYITRPFRKEDTLLWQKWDVDPEVQAYMPEPINNVQDIDQQYKYINECEQDEDGYYWSIDDVEGVTIGTVSIFEINSYHKTAEFGIVIGDKSYWNKGVSTEVGTSIIQYVFNNLNLERISAEVEEGNEAMKKVLERIGFEQDGLFKSARIKDGKRINVYHFGICK